MRTTMPRPGSGAPPPLPSRSSATLPTGVDLDPAARAGLVPACVDDFRRELTACLALCAPSGMDARDRDEWLRAAWATLRHLPADLLARGCAAARAEADHPSRIVPIVTRETADWLRLRRHRIEAEREERLPRLVPPAPAYCTAAEAAAILAELGLKHLRAATRAAQTQIRHVPSKESQRCPAADLA